MSDLTQDRLVLSDLHATILQLAAVVAAPEGNRYIAHAEQSAKGIFGAG